MTSVATAMPNTTELVHRLHRVAKMVVLAADHTPQMPGTAVGLAMWEVLTGVDDDAQALAYARRVAAPGWPTEYLSRP